MKRNQFLDLSGLIIEVKGETKGKSAKITVAIPDELAEKIMKSMCGSDIIHAVQLSYIDKEKDGWDND
jgi:hypothetical protein